MKRVKLVIMVGILMILGFGCTEISNKITETDSSILTLNVNWDEAVANESTNKAIEDAITKGYKVYVGIIKSSEVDKSGTINFKEKQEISYKINKSIKFTIKESDYTKYHICIFIDKDGDGVLSSWNHETIAYNYSVNIDSTSQTIDMPIKINNATSSSTLTFNVSWNEAVSKKGVEKSIIDEAVSKGYKAYIGIAKKSDVTKSGIFNFYEKQEIEYYGNKNVEFTIKESDYGIYTLALFIDRNGDGADHWIDDIEIISSKDITVNSVSQTIDVPVEVLNIQPAISSTLTFNVTWNEVVSKKGVEKSIIDEAVSKGYKLYLGIIKESEMVKGGIVKCTQQKEISYNTNSSVIFEIAELDYTKYQAYIYIDKDGDRKYDITGLEAIAGKLNIIVNSASQTIDMPVEISTNQIATSSTLTFNVSWNKSSESLVTEEKIDEAIAKGYKLYLGLLKVREVTLDGIARCSIKQEIEYNKNKEVKFIIAKADYTSYQAYIYIDKNGDGFASGLGGEMIAKNYSINVTSNSYSVNLPIYIKE